MVAGGADNGGLGLDHRRMKRSGSAEAIHPIIALPEHQIEGMDAEVVALDQVRRNRLSGRTASSASVRVVIADGQALVRAGFRVLLEGGNRIAVAGEAADGDEAVALAHRIRPDVVLLDANLPGLDSLEATRQLAEAGVAVMLLTESEHDERPFAALRAGATGLLNKDAEPAELVRAVE